MRLGPADEQLAEALPVLNHAFRLAMKYLSTAKRRARVLDFADLEVHALRALKHEEVRAYYRERWHAFLVDEFQDTNPVQGEPLDRLTEASKLTVVSDEKQSIYGFRRADVRVFGGFRERIRSEGGDEVLLSTSFRTHSDLMEKINAVFSSALGDLHQLLEAHREQRPHGAPHVRAYAMKCEDRVSKAELQRAEATHIARVLREMLDEQVAVYDDALGRPRPIRPGDVALLSRVWAPLETYGDALATAGIPSVHAGGGNLLETCEVKDGFTLLRFLADPHDDPALVALLRSPFFALGDLFLHELAQEREKGTPWWQLVREAPGAHIASAKEVLEELLGRQHLDLPTVLLRLADRLTGYTAVIANLPGAERREADWRGFRELVRELERGADDGFVVVSIAEELKRAVRKSGVEEGFCVISTHTTAGVVVNEDYDPDVPRDLAAACRALIGALDISFEHAAGNSDSHLLTSLFGQSQYLPLRGGEPDLGRWQGIFLAEFDGPRSRTVRVALIRPPEWWGCSVFDVCRLVPFGNMRYGISHYEPCLGRASPIGGLIWAGG